MRKLMIGLFALLSVGCGGMDVETARAEATYSEVEVANSVDDCQSMSMNKMTLFVKMGGFPIAGAGYSEDLIVLAPHNNEDMYAADRLHPISARAEIVEGDFLPIDFASLHMVGENGVAQIFEVHDIMDKENNEISLSGKDVRWTFEEQAVALLAAEGPYPQTKTEIHIHVISEAYYGCD